ncbi:MAG: formylglycine-generating enzyme family protein, partial [Gammaproteobacteria bacterium]|nr:formylglycine-generating enzyme family protein [Gammaproteobacteria bacterium]
RVSWLTVQKFIDKLNELTEGHYGFSLPTEAEWEYAARNGGKKIAYPWGDEVPVCRKGAKNGAKFNDTNKKDCNLTLTEPVESYAANKLGLYGMAGNVWEWTCSEYEEKYGEQETKCSSKNDNEGRRVLRGGSWRTKPKYMRAASRYDQSPDNRSANIGFRVALRAK